MIKGTATRVGVFLFDANGDGVAGLTPTASLRIDGTDWKAPTNPISDQANGRYELLLDAAEMNGAEIQIFWSDASAKSVLQNLYPLDPVLFMADVSALAKQTSVDQIPKRDDSDTYRTLRDGAGAIVQQIREQLHATEQP